LLKLDDIEVCIRTKFIEAQKTRTINELVNKVGWLSISKGNSIWQQSCYSITAITKILEDENK